MTQYPDVFKALAAPFAPAEVKSRKQGGHQLRYITARTVMNRLDEVLGPENWWDDYVPGESSVLCRLTIVLPDGRQLTKQDVGAYAGMSDQGDDDKSGYSDGFKRAAVKFGVGRYLYNDGVADYDVAPEASTPAQAPAEATGSSSGSGAGKVETRSYRDFVVDAVAYCNRQVTTAASHYGVEISEHDLCQIEALEKRLHAWAVAKGLRPKNEDRAAISKVKRAALLQDLYRDHGKPVRAAVIDFTRTFAERTTEKLQQFAGKGDAYES